MAKVTFGTIQDINGMVNLAKGGTNVIVFEPDADALMQAVTEILTNHRDSVLDVTINDAEVEAGIQNETVLIRIQTGSIKLINDTQSNSHKYE
jgi:hypothetical protein